jgi:alcohol dehydrogenase class IV
VTKAAATLAVPTTLAGADLSVVAGVTLTLDDPASAGDARSGGVADPRLMPAALVCDPDQLSNAVAGVVLAQYGVSTPGAFKLGVIHAFGHGFSRDFDFHQGVAHGAVTLAVLEALFAQVDGRRRGP